MAIAADGYSFTGHGLEGAVHLARGAGSDTTLRVNGLDVLALDTAVDSFEIQVTGTLPGAAADGDSTDVLIRIPVVHPAGRLEVFSGLALLVTRRNSIGGPHLVTGVLSSYEVRPVAGFSTVSNRRDDLEIRSPAP